MTLSSDEISALLGRLHNNVWELTAIVLALRDDNAEAKELVERLGLMQDGRPTDALTQLVESNALDLVPHLAAPILQCASLISGAKHWTAQDDEALVAQGRASAQGVPMMKAFVVPMLDGLGELLDGPAPEMLDVGVGSAAMAVEYCRNFPSLRIVGLDVFPRVLEIAERIVRDAGMSDRIELRNQDVATLDDVERFTIGWMPAPFVPRAALDAAIPRMVRALVPGGWIIVGHGGTPEVVGQEQERAITRFKTAAFGGTPLDIDEAQTLLRAAGLDGVTTLPTPPGAPRLTVGRRGLTA
jgi:SAM-dependent methyltransferase